MSNLSDMMDEYIKREDIRNMLLDYYGLRDAYKSNYRGNTLMDYEVHYMIEDCCDNAPAADVVEVRHGKWVAIDQTNPRPCYACSCCNSLAPIGFMGTYAKSTYCPNCGAKMDWGDGR